MSEKFLRLLRQFRGLFPSRLPVGATEFETWSNSIIETYTMPTQDLDSLKFSLASIIMHSGPQDFYRSKYFFVLTLNAAAAKQVAGQVFYDIKTKHQELAKKQQEEEAANTLPA